MDFASKSPSEPVWGVDNGMVNWYGDLSGALLAATAKGAKSLIVLIGWMIWCERNRRIFDGFKRRSDQLVAMIQAEARQWILVELQNYDVLSLTISMSSRLCTLPQ
jgi:hypothetical protein